MHALATMTTESSVGSKWRARHPSSGPLPFWTVPCPTGVWADASWPWPGRTAWTIGSNFKKTIIHVISRGCYRGCCRFLWFTSFCSVFWNPWSLYPIFRLNNATGVGRGTRSASAVILIVSMWPLHLVPQVVSTVSMVRAQVWQLGLNIILHVDVKKYIWHI
jgi:hypothetical protein